MPKYVVETISSFKMRYVIEADCATYALDSIICDKIEDTDQEWLGETIISVREATAAVLAEKLDVSVEAARLDTLVEIIEPPLDNDDIVGC